MLKWRLDFNEQSQLNLGIHTVSFNSFTTALMKRSRCDVFNISALNVSFEHRWAKIASASGLGGVVLILTFDVNSIINAMNING
jgi:hypothetical protein